MGESNKYPLSETVVISVGHTWPGLYCLAMLRDLGARIIRIERPSSNESGNYQGLDKVFPVRSLTTGTDSVQLNLKHEKGIETFRRLANQAHVVLEGFRPGVMQRLGIDYAALCKQNPKLVYAAITGYGQTGPNRDKAGHDINYLAETGVLALTNPIGLPGAAYADGIAGVSAALNIVAALHSSEKTGVGQMIDCAIVDGPLFLMTSEFEYLWNTGQCRSIGGTHLTGSHPWYGVYNTKDDKQVAVGAVESPFYNALCQGLGHPELSGAQFARGKTLEDAKSKITVSFADKSREEAEGIFEEHNACASLVLDTKEVTESPLMPRATRQDDVTGEPVVRTPVRLPPASLTASKQGSEVLLAFGFKREEIDDLVKGEVIDNSV